MKQIIKLLQNAYFLSLSLVLSTCVYTHMQRVCSSKYIASVKHRPRLEKKLPALEKNYILSYLLFKNTENM